MRTKDVGKTMLACDACLLEEVLTEKEGLERVIGLLSEGADANVRDESGMSALTIAVLNENERYFKELLKYSNLNSTGQDGKTVLHWAALTGQEKFVRALLVMEIDIGKKDLNGCDAANWADAKGFQNLGDLIRGYERAKMEEEDLGREALEGADRVRRKFL